MFSKYNQSTQNLITGNQFGGWFILFLIFFSFCDNLKNMRETGGAVVSFNGGILNYMTHLLEKPTQRHTDMKFLINIPSYTKLF